MCGQRATPQAGACLAVPVRQQFIVNKYIRTPVGDFLQEAPVGDALQGTPVGEILQGAACYHIVAIQSARYPVDTR